MSRPRSAPDLYLLSKASTLYYLRDLTQAEIAKRLGVSRPTVSRLLNEARERGIVTIRVTPAPGMHLDLESQMESRYHLEEAVVVSAEKRRSGDILRQIGGAASAYLARTVQPGETIGLAWGHTLNAMVQATPALPREGLRIVQILGGVGPPDGKAYAADMVRRLARQFGAAPVLLPAPGVVSTPAGRDALRKDPHVMSALKAHDKLDTAFVGIGSLLTNEVLNDGHSLPRGTFKRLVDAGAVSDIALRFFDDAGRAVHTALDDRILGISVEQLRKVKRVVAVAGGKDKIDAIRSALRTGIVNVLVTDQATATALADE